MQNSKTVVLKGLNVYETDPLKIDFLVHETADTIDSQWQDLSQLPIQHFLAALTIPEEEVWVNLSPKEKDRIMPDVLAETLMGKELLAQDYQLKQYVCKRPTNPSVQVPDFSLR